MNTANKEVDRICTKSVTLDVRLIKMNPDVKEKFISWIDLELTKLDFKFVKSRQLWKRTSKTDEEWIHLNCGLSVFNVSFGVEYKELKKVLEPQLNPVIMASETLSKYCEKNFSEYSNEKDLAQTIVKIIPDKLECLKNRKMVMDKLLSESSEDWPVSSFSHRIRLLIILLLKYDSISKSIEYANTFEKQYSDIDQMLPNFTVYKAAIIEKYKGLTRESSE